MESLKIRIQTTSSKRGNNWKIESHKIRITTTCSTRGDNWNIIDKI